ncbi:ATP-binding cassette domain-containing protein, partial [Escherichia coli]|uniref:ATP-binding cassette domain-containing protein n=1 Tax=Escherichia coli TaxID=562 RepID=UPI00210B1BCE
GVFLSGGQRQRITIARALLQDRPILELDEATAFADPENEAALIKALAAAMRGRTVIMVAHRLSMVTQADVILLFSDGQLRELGNHTQLLAQGGLYQRLWQHYQQAQHWVPGALTLKHAGSDLIFELEDRPPFHQALVGAITHLL